MFLENESDLYLSHAGSKYPVVITLKEGFVYEFENVGVSKVVIGVGEFSKFDIEFKW